MQDDIREKLKQLVDEKYRMFSAKLLPGVDNILGVRIPVLHKLGKKIAIVDGKDYLAHAQDDYFEEVMLQGIVIGLMKCPLQEKLEYIKDFLPKINNWSICDHFCVELKFTRVHRQQMWAFIKSYLASKNEYELRFAVVMLLDYYIDDKYIEDVLQLLDGVKHDYYYVKMAVSWALSICYIKERKVTTAYLRHNRLDKFTYNKTLQKITGSLQVSAKEKLQIKKMRRK